jgi:4-hydroxy-tetrahydrodipicolinate reductase
MIVKRYRVAQWATGNVGLQSLRAIIEHPHYDLVALKVYSDAKVGRDAGELCGVAPTGIIATQNIGDIIAAQPDCVVYMPDRAEIDVMCQILAAGINIATSRMEFNFRNRIEPGARQQLEAACAHGRSSLFACGSTPGWSTEIMPLALTAMLRRLDGITLTEFADMSSRNSPEMLFDLLHFGADPATLPPNQPHLTAMSTPPSLSMTADALGLPVDDVICTVDYAVTRERVEIAAGTLEPGTIGAMRMEITGMRHGTPVIRRRTTWYVAKNIEPPWELRETGWHYRIDGDTPLEVMITIPVSAADYPKISPGLTAHPIVNAIPNICRAAPGIRHLAEIGPIIAHLGR